MKLQAIPKTIQLAWHGVNDRLNLEYFLKSPIPWAEGDLRHDGNLGLVLRHDGFDTHPLRENESLLPFQEWLEMLLASGKSIKVDLKEGCGTMEKMIQLLKDHRVDEKRLWITTNLKDVSMDDFVFKMRARALRPTCCFRQIQGLTVTFQTPEAALVKVKMGFDSRTRGTTFDTTLTFYLRKEEGEWRVAVRDFLRMPDETLHRPFVSPPRPPSR